MGEMEHRERSAISSWTRLPPWMEGQGTTLGRYGGGRGNNPIEWEGRERMGGGGSRERRGEGEERGGERERRGREVLNTYLGGRGPFVPRTSQILS